MNEHKLYIDIERIVLNHRSYSCDNEFTSEIFHSAKNHFEELKAENKALREALKPFAAVTDRDLELWYGLDPDPFVPDDAALITIDSSPTVGDLRAARAAMGEKE